MAKQLNVNLAFNADISKAKSSILELQKALNQVINMPESSDLGLKEASEAAKALSYHLNQAYNTTTGNIDLSKLNHSLAKSSTNVTELSNKLLKAGSAGQQAFIGLAKSISNADYPMFKLNAKLSEMLTTLKNTARWQLSSSILHGFMGAVQEAYGYVQDLNESLVNIQVVTGKNADEMARFAEQANRAAKNLGTRTTDYTNASLIYYQQGLDEEEVLKRADITVKMANVAGVSAEIASDQLTAVWNNFAKTGDNLEYYADVMTALGAATASSTDEIAGGLEKFAAIADTIGLSYEYAASALATITSNTRQSEEVVGTALKTIFARIQGLNLGETLDDGTTLNKYSEALDKVGISIFEQNGEIKKMDAILDEMGTKWQTIAKDEQIALAQTVAGVRQYNQLISLMDNWDAGDSDSMLANLETAYNATGALQQQADIWGESWEAASNRVATAAQGIYDSLLDDKLFINFNNIFADMLSGVEQVIDGVGGLKGVLIGISSFFITLMSHKIQPALAGFVLNVKSLFQSAQAQASALVGQIQEKTNQELKKGSYTIGEQQELKNASLLSEARTRLTMVSKNLTEQEKQLYQMDIGMMELSTQKAQNIASEITALEKERDTIYQSVDATKEKIAINNVYEQELNSLIATQQIWRELLDNAYEDGTKQDQLETAEGYQQASQAIDEYINSKQILNEIIQQTTQAIMDEYTGQEYANDSFKQGEGVLQAFTQNLNAMSIELGEVNREFTPDEVDSYKRQLNLLSKTFEQMKGLSSSTKKELAQLFSQAKVSKGSKELQNNITQIIAKIKTLKFTSAELKQMGISLSPTQFQNFLTNLDQGVKKEKELITVQEELQKRLDSFNPIHMISGLERIVSLASSLGSIAMVGQSISSMIDSWNNADLSFGEKLSTTLMSISMIVPSVISAFKGLRTVISGTSIETALYNVALKKQGLVQKEVNGEKILDLTLTKASKAEKVAEATITGVLVTALKAENIEITKEEAAKLKGLIASKLRKGASLKEAIATALVTLRSGDAKKAINAETAAKVADKAATDALNTSIKSLLGPIGLAIAALTALVAILSAVAKAQEEAAKKAKENRLAEAEASQKAAEEAKKLNDANKELYKTYNDLRMRNDESTTAKEQLRAATDELCKALGVEWDALDRLQDKYENVNNAILEKRKEQIQATIDAYDAAIKDNEDIIEDKVDNVLDEYNFGHSTGMSADGKTSYDRVYANIDYGMSYGGWGDPADEEVLEAFTSYLEKNYSNKLYSSGRDNRGNAMGQLRFNEDVSEQEALDIILEGFKYVRDNSKGLGISETDQRDSEAYQWLRTLYNDSDVSELLSKIAADEAAREEALGQMAEINAELAQAQVEAGLSIREITDIKDYEAYKDQYVTELRTLLQESGADMNKYTDSVLEDMADAYLTGYSNIATIIEENDIMEAIKERTSLDSTTLDKVAADYKDFFTISKYVEFDKIQSEEELRNILDILQAQANATEIQTQIDVVHTAKGNLKENMTLADYNDFKTESGINWGEFDKTLNKEIISYGEFLQLAYSQQIEYLDNLEQSYIAKQTSGIQKTITDSQNLLTSYKNELNALLEDQSANGATVEGLTRIEELKSLINALEQYIPILNETSAAINNSLASSVSKSFSETINSLDDLYAKTQQLKDSGIEVSLEEYGSALVELAGNYDNCIDEIDDYNKALLTEDKNQIQAASSALELAIEIGELSKKFNLNAKEIEAYSKRLKNSLNISEQAANKLAIANSRVDRGLLDLNKNFDTYTKALKENAEGTATWSSTMDSIKTNLADIFNIDDGSMLSDSFVQSIINSEELKLALDGDIASIEHLQALAADDIIINIVANQSETPEDIRTAWEQLKIDFASTDIDAPGIDQTNLINSFNDLIAKGQMTKEQIEAALSGLHVSADVKTNYVAQRVTVPTTITDQSRYITGYDEIDTNMDGELESVARWRTVTATHTGEPVTVDGWIPQYTIEGTEGEGGIQTAFTSAPSISVSAASTTSGGAGSSSSSKPKEKFKIENKNKKTADEEIERYHEINNELEVLADNLDAISKKKDRAYGANRVKLIDQETVALKQQLSAQERYLNKIENYLADDRAKIDKYGFMFNEDADIINYDEVMDQQIQAYNAAYQAYITAKNAAIDAFNAAVQSGTSKEDAEKIYDATIKAADATWESAQERYETFEKELQQYEKSVDLLRQQQQVLQDIKYQIQDLNYEKIQYKLEVKMEINDAEMRMLDYYLNKLSDDFYSMAEAAQLMVDKVPLMMQALGNYESFYHELESAYAAGDISQEAYVDGLKQSYDGILNNLEALQDLDKQMMHYYEDTLAAGMEELAQYTDHMEHLTGVLDHYHNLITMINGEEDYESIDTVLRGKATTLKNEVDVAASNYEMLKREQAAIQASYDSAVDENARELFANELKAINAQVDEAHETLLSKTEGWAEVQKAIMENVMREAAHEMEMAFTSGLGFDGVSDSLARLSSLSEEYLTKTNQIYETQKLINTAQQAIDKTTNNAAKIRLKNYQDEISALQEKNKLTQLDLDIAKAKYEVLLAEIALEEAQNAKATVRLQRDSEGNFGYVYTADQAKVADAEQKLADAQNALYNTRLEAANNYGQKILELNQQLYDQMEALDQAYMVEHSISEEEYNQRKEMLLREYYDLYEVYSHNYTTALEEDASIQTEAWITAYEEIIRSAENWQQYVTMYDAKCGEAYQEYRQVVETESDIINDLLSDVAGSVKDVTDESTNLKNKVMNEVLPSIQREFEHVRDVTQAYANKRTAIQELIAEYEKLAEAILNAMKAEQLAETWQDPTQPKDNEPEDPTPPGTDPTVTGTIGHSDMVQLVHDIMVNGSYENDPVRTQKILDAGFNAKQRADAQAIVNELVRDHAQAWHTGTDVDGKSWSQILDEHVTAKGYDTGGYTGMWGPEGRLAWLHQKELVLNATDTENFLAATNILRDISRMIDLNSIYNQTPWLSSTGMSSGNQQALEQQVSIEAHFPNVSDRNEIEEAFNNLINTASQYANRKF